MSKDIERAERLARHFLSPEVVCYDYMKLLAREFLEALKRERKLENIVVYVQKYYSHGKIYWMAAGGEEHVGLDSCGDTPEEALGRFLLRMQQCFGGREPFPYITGVEVRNEVIDLEVHEHAQKTTSGQDNGP